MKFRGHHVYDFFWYLQMRDDGNSHEEILKRSFKIDWENHGRGEKFERHANGIFQKIYEGQIESIVLIAGLDAVCLGPENDSRWCSLYQINDCLGEKLIAEDKWDIGYLGFIENVPIATDELVRKVRSIDIIQYMHKKAEEMSNIRNKN